MENKVKDIDFTIDNIIPALRMILSDDGLKTLKLKKWDTLNVKEKTSKDIFRIEGNDPEILLTEMKIRLADFKKSHGNFPNLILIQDVCLLAVGNNAKECELVLEQLENARAVSTDENKQSNSGRVYNKTIIVTGAAQGFGEGIARCLLLEGANIVVADLNETIGKATVEKFNSLTVFNRAIFVKTNVSDIPSIENLIHQTICNFGAVDTFISNAGVLRAGGLDDMTPEDFDFVTKINYNAYFYCTKVVSKTMKLQTQFATDYYADIIQINSKSGLRGSKANFAYAGGKFGGVGLTQSFALELAPFQIKVNSICPGNFYEGPLWSDPVNGLFVQYLNAGKVPGAKTIEDVKAFYLAQVPLQKGCSPDDVTKGVLYLMEQCGETGQALPITGGQVMLG